MARYECVRCEAHLNTLDPPHLCKDIVARLKEAERRAAYGCRGTGSLEGWLLRLAHEDPHGRPPRFVEVTVDHHGIYTEVNR